MMAKSFRQCALHYLKQWCDYDRRFCRGFSSGLITCELLREICLQYGVDRTVPGHGPEKYKEFVEMLNCYRDIQMTRQNVPDIIEEELRNMRRAYGGSFLSAITKAFWMMKRHPVVIYDSNVRGGLQHYRLPSGQNNYRIYYDSWFHFFECDDTQRRLQDATAWIRKSRGASKKPNISTDELNELAGSEWFRNRVTDIRLFYVGKDKAETLKRCR
jgi:hypothetical protein